MATALKRQGGFYAYEDEVTKEIVGMQSPVSFEEEFLGFEPLLTETGSKGLWSVVEVALNTVIGLIADQGGGVLGIQMDADANAEDGVLYWGNQRGIDVSKGAFFECRVNLQVLPSTAVARMVWGMAGDHNLAKDSVTEHAWFRCEGGDSDALLVESDDTTNDNDDIDAGATFLAATVWHHYAIDFRNLADVRFYADGSRVASATTFDMSNLTAAEAIMQPYFSVEKDSGTGVGSMYIDYVRIYSRRA